jgi:hypothetical protein
VSLGNSQTEAAAGDLMKYFEKLLSYFRKLELNRTA